MATELGRFVLLDSVPANGESFFLGQCFTLLRREGLAGVPESHLHARAERRVRFGTSWRTEPV